MEASSTASRLAATTTWDGAGKHRPLINRYGRQAPSFGKILEIFKVDYQKRAVRGKTFASFAGKR